MQQEGSGRPTLSKLLNVSWCHIVGQSNEVSWDNAHVSISFVSIAGVYRWRVRWESSTYSNVYKNASTTSRHERNSGLERGKTKEQTVLKLALLKPLTKGPVLHVQSREQRVVRIRALYCTYCIRIVKGFLCTKHIVKLKFNSHFSWLVNGFWWSCRREYIDKGHSFKGDFLLWLNKASEGRVRQYIDWVFIEEKHTNLRFKCVYFSVKYGIFVCLAAEPAVNKSYLSLWIVVLRRPGRLPVNVVPLRSEWI